MQELDESLKWQAEAQRWEERANLFKARLLALVEQLEGQIEAGTAKSCIELREAKEALEAGK